jgi:hypothetical protein
LTETAVAEVKQVPRGGRRVLWPAAFLGLLAVSVAGGLVLSSRISAARAANATLTARLDLAVRGREAVEEVRADLEGALAIYRDDEAGRAWLSLCAFPVGATPAGNARLPAEGPASLILLVRPTDPVVFTVPGGARAEAPLVRFVAWYPAESPESPALVSWESSPLADARALAALPAASREAAVEALSRAGILQAWDGEAPAERGVRPLDLLGGGVSAEPREGIFLAGAAKRWCGDAAGAPVLSRVPGHPAFAVRFSGPPEARRAEIRLALEVLPAGEHDPLRSESAAVATRLRP